VNGLSERETTRLSQNLACKFEARIWFSKELHGRHLL